MKSQIEDLINQWIIKHLDPSTKIPADTIKSLAKFIADHWERPKYDLGEFTKAALSSLTVQEHETVKAERALRTAITLIERLETIDRFNMQFPGKSLKNIAESTSPVRM